MKKARFERVGIRDCLTLTAVAPVSIGAAR
jgi:hypothetical protein